MASTNTTANYGLPQYVANDKPTYLGDFNAAMLSIDTAIKGVSDIATANQTGLASLDTTVEDQGERLGTVEAETTVNTSDIATANQNITNLQSLTSTQGQQIATVTQTANASALVIGSGALSTQADKIIPAINEINSNITNVNRYTPNPGSRIDVQGQSYLQFTEAPLEAGTYIIQISYYSDVTTLLTKDSNYNISTICDLGERGGVVLIKLDNPSHLQLYINSEGTDNHALHRFKWDYLKLN